MPQKLLWALGLILALSFLTSFKNKRRRQSAWTGSVTELRHQRPSVARDEDRAAEDWVTLAYRTDEGRDGKLNLRMASLRQYLPGIQAGDRLVKRQGDYLPRRASADTAADTTESSGQA